jgi:hypothetical protein
LEQAASKRHDALSSHGATGRTRLPVGVATEVFIAPSEPAVYGSTTLGQKSKKFRWRKLA